MEHDPILKEVHAAKRKIALEANHDVHRLAERFRNAQERYADRLAKPVSKTKTGRLLAPETCTQVT